MAKVAQEDILTVGKLGKVYGLKGWIRLVSYTEPADNIFAYTPWYVKQGGQWQPCELVAHKAHAKDWLVRLADCNDCDEASYYINALIGTAKSNLPPCAAGEFYWHELLGMSVTNQDGSILGTVTDVFATGANDVLVVEDDKHKECLLPYIDDVVLEVLREHNQIRVAWDDAE